MLFRTLGDLIFTTQLYALVPWCLGDGDVEGILVSGYALVPWCLGDGDKHGILVSEYALAPWCLDVPYWTPFLDYVRIDVRPSL